MSWSHWHRLSEEAAEAAHLAVRNGLVEEARQLFSKAADAEVQALAELSINKTRTLGVTAVSATALRFKANELNAAEKIALQWLSSGLLPAFATDQLRELVQAIWTRSAMEAAGVTFLPGQVVVSISGGETVVGGAPLDLIVERVQIVQAIFFRTIEFLMGLHHRSKGGPSVEIQDACRPWLFQAAPGSYQFSVAIQRPRQYSLLDEGPTPPEVGEKFLSILRAANSDPEGELVSLVPAKDYRSTFLKLSRNLAPTGKNLTKVEVRAAEDVRGSGVLLQVESRKLMNAALRSERAQSPQAQQIQLRGVLRAVHLDKDWIDLQTQEAPVHITGLPAAVDDLIGPMVNRRVIVSAIQTSGGYRFVDVEADD